MKLYRKMFHDYVKQFDLKDKMIMTKFHHTYRVMDYANEIALSIHANPKVASICGLFHDIGRFEQWTKYHTFIDSISVNHGDLGTEILKNFSIEQKDLVIFTTKNHNKFQIEVNSNPEFILYTNIVRDADKLDIMVEQGNQIDDNDFQINQTVIDTILKHQLVMNQDVKNEADSILRLLGFVFDINFEYTYQFILDKKIIENKIHLLKCYIENPILETIEKDLLEYVHKKVEGKIC